MKESNKPFLGMVPKSPGGLFRCEGSIVVFVCMYLIIFIIIFCQTFVTVV